MDVLIHASKCSLKRHTQSQSWWLRPLRTQQPLTSTLFSTLSPLTSSWTERLRISFTLRPTASRTLSKAEHKVTWHLTVNTTQQVEVRDHYASYTRTMSLIKHVVYLLTVPHLELKPFCISERPAVWKWVKARALMTLRGRGPPVYDIMPPSSCCLSPSHDEVMRVKTSQWRGEHEPLPLSSSVC